jgi:hypothetical protein
MQCIFVALSRPRLGGSSFDRTLTGQHFLGADVARSVRDGRRLHSTACECLSGTSVTSGTSGTSVTSGTSGTAHSDAVRGFKSRERNSARSGRPLRVKRNRNLENDRSPQSPSRRRSANFIHRHKQHMSAARRSRVISSQGLLRNDGDARSDFATILAPRCSPNRNDDIWRWLTRNAPAPSVHNDSRRD